MRSEEEADRARRPHPAGRGRSRVRTATVGALEDLGYEPIACSSGAEALALFDSMEFDLVISDVIMPEMTGPEMVREMKSRRGDIAVLFVTGYVGEGEGEDLVGYDLLRSRSPSARWRARLPPHLRAGLSDRARSRSRGSRLIAASSGCRFCQGFSSMSVPAWRLIFQAIYSAPPA